MTLPCLISLTRWCSLLQPPSLLPPSLLPPSLLSPSLSLIPLLLPSIQRSDQPRSLHPLTFSRSRGWQDQYFFSSAASPPSSHSHADGMQSTSQTGIRDSTTSPLSRSDDPRVILCDNDRTSNRNDTHHHDK